ncbi:MAG: HAD-IB family phosphatase [Thermoplasmata archaeon]|nr:HAD-IB family phosphatase [Thermoplasmata archaeon]
MKLIVFDMDGVLIEERSSWRVIHNEFKIDNSDILKELHEGKLSQEEFLNKEIEKMREHGLTKKQIMEALERVSYMKGLDRCLNFIKNWNSAIISGGIKCVADKIARKGIKYVYANEIIFKDEIPWKGKLNVPFFNKKDVLEKFLDNVDASFVIVVGDSKYDVSMFDLSDVAIAFNPGDEVIEQKADFVVKSKDMNDLIKILKRYY